MRHAFALIALLTLVAPLAQASVCLVRIATPDLDHQVDIYTCDGKQVIPNSPPEATAFLQKLLTKGYKIAAMSWDQQGDSEELILVK